MLNLRLVPICNDDVAILDMILHSITNPQLLDGSFMIPVTLLLRVVVSRLLFVPLGALPSWRHPEIEIRFFEALMAGISNTNLGFIDDII
jgi:hypothetical protein